METPRILWMRGRKSINSSGHTWRKEAKRYGAIHLSTGMSSSAETPVSGALERFFKLKQNKTDIRTELLAGVTTFVTLAYVLFVYPNILKDAGMPVNSTFVATCVASAFATLLMGLYANYPIAVAPGMGLGAYFTYTVCAGMGLPWQTALGAVFISGVVFFLLTVTRVREWIVDGVPPVLRSAIGVGIGLFIAFIGLRNAGIVVKSDATLVTRWGTCVIRGCWWQ